MKVNLQALMDRFEVNAAQFAEKIGVQRSSISHFLSGRNNPSLEVIRKILMAYPQIDAEWLLSGEGDMIKNDFYKPPLDEKEMPPTNQNLFSILKEEEQAPYNLNQPIVEAEVPYNQENNSIKSEKYDKPHPTKVEVERVVIFYQNGTFKEYFPQNNETILR